MKDDAKGLESASIIGKLEMPKFSLHELRQELLEKFNYTCQSCGSTEAPLELSHIVPLSQGGTNQIDNFTVLCGPCNRSLGNFRTRAIEFSSFLQDILAQHPDYRNVVAEAQLDAHVRADLTAIRRVEGKEQVILIELKSRSYLRQRQIEDVIEQISRYRTISPFDATVLAFPGRISNREQVTLNRANIEVWDLDYIASTFAKEISSLPPSRLKHIFSMLVTPSVVKEEDVLLQRLHDCPPGKSHWVEYQSIVQDIFEFLFSPPLGIPISESPDLSGTNRRDIVFPNYTYDDFWRFVRERYNADFIVVDAKNYKNSIKKAQVLQIANYLKPHGAGLFAIIACRKGGDSGCIHTLREQWAAYGKLIVLISDDDMVAMLNVKGARGHPEDVIGDVIQKFRLSM